VQIVRPGFGDGVGKGEPELERYDPKWGLSGGLILIGVGDLWAASLSPDANLSTLS
jgi:hypothetical protein